MKKIVLAGATGFIGKYLEKKFRAAKYEVLMISRQPQHINWNDRRTLVASLEGADLLINLAGKSVDCRYNEKNKKEIFDSRINTTNILGEAILQCKKPPLLWINSGTATIYRHAEDRPMTESGGEIGSGFSVNVATGWENAFFSFALPQTRQIVLRIAIVLGKDGGVISPLKNLVKCGLGGHQGSGKQMFSWIHIEDLYNIILFVEKHKELKGVFNAAAPGPVSNKIFMSLFKKNMAFPFGIPCPEWLLKFGAVIIKTEPELILKSRWVLPERLLQNDFHFKFDTLDDALKNILHK